MYFEFSIVGYRSPHLTMSIDIFCEIKGIITVTREPNTVCLDWKRWLTLILYTKITSCWKKEGRKKAWGRNWTRLSAFQSSGGDVQELFRISHMNSVTTKTQFSLFTYCTTPQNSWLFLACKGWGKTDVEACTRSHSEKYTRFIRSEAPSFLRAELHLSSLSGLCLFLSLTRSEADVGHICWLVIWCECCWWALHVLKGTEILPSSRDQTNSAAPHFFKY